MPPQDPLFDSAWLKWGRAVTHGQTLKTDIERLTGHGHFQPVASLGCDYNPKRHGFVVTVDSLRPIPPLWGLLLGDITNNYRSCLDHIAWALVLRGGDSSATTDKKRLDGIHFPICDGPKMFRGEIGKKLPGVRPRPDLAIVRRYQPYKAGKRNMSKQTIRVLNTLNNHHKHRRIEPLWFLPESARYEIADQRDCDVPSSNLLIRRTLLYEGAEITCIRARKAGPDPHIEVKAQLFGKPALNKDSLIGDWLREAERFIGRLVREFSEPPPELDEIGIDFDALGK